MGFVVGGGFLFVFCFSCHLGRGMRLNKVPSLGLRSTPNQSRFQPGVAGPPAVGGPP